MQEAWYWRDTDKAIDNEALRHKRHVERLEEKYLPWKIIKDEVVGDREESIAVSGWQNTKREIERERINRFSSLKVGYCMWFTFYVI